MNKLQETLSARSISFDQLVEKKARLPKEQSTGNYKLQCFSFFDDLYDGSPHEYDSLNYTIEESLSLYYPIFSERRQSELMDFRYLSNVKNDEILTTLQKFEQSVNIQISQVSKFNGSYIRRKFAYELEPIYLIKKLVTELETCINSSKTSTNNTAISLTKIILSNLKNTCLHINLEQLQRLDQNNINTAKTVVDELKPYLHHIPATVKKIKNNIPLSLDAQKEYKLAEEIQSLYDELNNYSIFRNRLENLGESKQDKIRFLQEVSQMIVEAKSMITYDSDYVKWLKHIASLDDKSLILMKEISRIHKDQWLSTFEKSYSETFSTTTV